jgi:hypothetical protein
MLCHKSGEHLVSEAVIAPAKNDIQSLGSYITYLKRYTYMSIIGVAVGEDDDDGNKAVVHQAPVKPTYAPAKPYIPAPKRTDLPPDDVMNQ